MSRNSFGRLDSRRLSMVLLVLLLLLLDSFLTYEIHKHNYSGTKLPPLATSIGIIAWFQKKKDLLSVIKANEVITFTLHTAPQDHTILLRNIPSSCNKKR